VKKQAPVLTLAAVAVLGGALLTLNVLNDPGRQDAAAAAPVPSAVSAADGAPPGDAVVVPDAAAAPGPAAPEPAAAPAPAVAEQAYTGRSAGDEVTVAVAVKDGRAVAYVCDGEEIEAWLEGTLTGGELSLQGRDGNALTGTLEDGAAFGRVTADGKEWPFSASAVEAPAGLYEGRANIRGVATRIGWIVEGDGEVTGLAQAEGSARPAPAPAFDPGDPGATRIEGVAVTVAAVGGDADVVRR
jgi:hypothetical protein